MLISSLRASRGDFVIASVAFDFVIASVAFDFVIASVAFDFVIASVARQSSFCGQTGCNALFKHSSWIAASQAPRNDEAWVIAREAH